MSGQMFSCNVQLLRADAIVDVKTDCAMRTTFTPRQAAGAIGVGVTLSNDTSLPLFRLMTCMISLLPSWCVRLWV
jgi:hypothetical protein